ncbi:porin [Glaciecola sp. MF2-115]|uniref:porin n=1 Tax=Glaciecola sp. MF2-115 TaxID=3384827 RepID=UPI0039A3A69A
MKMYKSLVAASIISAVAAPVAADPTLYGKVNVTVQNSDDGTESKTELKSNASRLGVKGEYELDGGLSVIYKYEFQVDVTDESGEQNIKSRNQYIGLRGAFGEVILGRNDTVLKQSQGKFDIYSDQEADIKKLWSGENRMSDSITYKTPEINNFQFGVSYIIDEDNDDSATSMSLTYGDSGLKKTEYYAAIAMDNEVKGYDVTRLTVGTKISGVVIGAMYQSQEEVETGEDKSGFMLSAKYKVGDYSLNGQFQTIEDDSGFTLGADRKLGKNTTAFAYYTTFNFDMDEDESYLAIGLEQKF